MDADEVYRESPSEERLEVAHDAVIERWEDEHPEWLEDVRPRMLRDPEEWPEDLNEAERRFISHKQAELAGDDV